MKSVNSAFNRLLLFLVVIVMVVGAGILWWKDAIAPVDPTDTTPVMFVVNSGDGVKAITSKLAEQHLIRSSSGFFILVKLMGIETSLQAGDYRLNRTMSAGSIAREMTHGMLDTWITTLEGWRDEEIATKLAKEFDIPESQFLQFAKIGYMFPDTYLIPRDATAAAIVQIFIDTFNEKITQQMRIDSQKTGLSFSDVIILASIVEREGVSSTDRPIIAGILLKRLKADWPLQADATLQYALGYQSDGRTWWKKYLTDEDKKINSPYNSYLNTGLPPAPISNPGLESIKAVIYPTDTPYWFYLHDPKGGVHYAKTAEEHNANIARYLKD